MYQTLQNLSNELDAVAAQVMNSMPNNEPLNLAHGNWSFPGVNRDELAYMAIRLRQIITEQGSDSQPSNDALLVDYLRRLTFLRANTVPQLWANAQVAVSSYSTTLNSLEVALNAAFKIETNSLEGQKIEAAKALTRLQRPLRAMEARLSELDTRSLDIDTKMAAIEHAYEAADQLPEDLESLRQHRKAIETILNEANNDKSNLQKELEDLRKIMIQLENDKTEVSAVLLRCNEAYRATTSEGLASAFSERASKLNISMWIWVVGLVAALLTGGSLGYKQLEALMLTLNAPMHDVTALWVNLLLALLSVGGPVWFAWVATKQIGQRFRLAEDYGYKASISKAYEGYRREAALVDPAFQSRLFSSTLNRLDEVPLRLVETETHGSPWHELASSKLIREAATSVPDFVEKVTDLAKQVLPKSAEKKIPE
jgi:hypothetical protein